MATVGMAAVGFIAVRRAHQYVRFISSRYDLERWRLTHNRAWFLELDQDNLHSLGRLLTSKS